MLAEDLGSIRLKIVDGLLALRSSFRASKKGSKKQEFRLQENEMPRSPGPVYGKRTFIEDPFFALLGPW